MLIQGLYLVKLSHIEQINKRVRLLRLSLPQPIKVRDSDHILNLLPAPGLTSINHTHQ